MASAKVLHSESQQEVERIFGPNYQIMLKS